jgi:hypothetical protein
MLALEKGTRRTHGQPLTIIPSTIEFLVFATRSGRIGRGPGGGSCWKSGGGRTRLYSSPKVGLADEASSDATPDAAGCIFTYRRGGPYCGPQTS